MYAICLWQHLPSTKKPSFASINLPLTNGSVMGYSFDMFSQAFKNQQTDLKGHPGTTSHPRSRDAAWWWRHGRRNCGGHGGNGGSGRGLWSFRAGLAMFVAMGMQFLGDSVGKKWKKHCDNFQKQEGKSWFNMKNHQSHAPPSQKSSIPCSSITERYWDAETI